MVIAIVSDVHGNWEGLQAVWRAAEGVDIFWCLGDTVGYGADPSQCLAAVRQRCAVVLRGNHDETVATGRKLDWFNPWAKEALLWTQDRLDGSELDYLSRLPEKACVRLESERLPAVWLAHGSLREPLEEYILNHEIAAANLQRLKEAFAQTLPESDAPAVLFFGHTHIAEAYFLPPKSRRIQHRRFLTDTEMVLEPSGTYLINVGSVGQPRDGNPKASFGTLDTETLTVRVFRVRYNIDAAAQKILRSGLPSELALRLYQGW